MHTEYCALHDDGPCTCGTEEVLADLALEEAELEAIDGY